MKKFFRASNVVLLLLCAMYFITYLDRVNVSTAAAGFGKEFGLSKTQIGLVFSAFAYPYLIFQIIGGWVSDRFGARRTLIACGLLWAAATVLTGLAGGLAAMLVARVLLGLGEGADVPGRDRGDVALGRQGAAGLRPGHHARRGARRQRGRAGGRGCHHGGLRLARIGLRLRGVQLCLESALWAATFTEHPVEPPAHHGGGDPNCCRSPSQRPPRCPGACCSSAWRR